MSPRTFLDPFSFQKALTFTVLFSSTMFCSPQSTFKGSLHRDIKIYGSIIFPGGSVVKSPPANAGDARDAGLMLGVGRSPGGGHSNPLQCYFLENPHGQRNLADYSPWDHKESDKAEQLSIIQYNTIQYNQM